MFPTHDHSLQDLSEKLEALYSAFAASDPLTEDRSEADANHDERIETLKEIIRKSRKDCARETVARALADFVLKFQSGSDFDLRLSNVHAAAMELAGSGEEIKLSREFICQVVDTMSSSLDTLLAQPISACEPDTDLLESVLMFEAIGSSPEWAGVLAQERCSGKMCFEDWKELCLQVRDLLEISTLDDRERSRLSGALSLMEGNGIV